MKVGTDAVLLGALAGSEKSKDILDIGTGCGVVALVMAQRHPQSIVHALDTDAASVLCATKNFAESPWGHRLRAFHTSVQDYANTYEGQYDCIVCNPPFFSHSLKCSSEKRNMARHNDSLPPEELSRAVDRLLSLQGEFDVILPLPESEMLSQEMSKLGFYTQKEIKICSVTDRPIRKILKFGRTPSANEEKEELTIHNIDGSYTQQYRDLTEDLYLWEK